MDIERLLTADCLLINVAASMVRLRLFKHDVAEGGGSVRAAWNGRRRGRADGVDCLGGLFSFSLSGLMIIDI